MPSNAQLVREYTDRALRLIRYGNAQTAEVEAALRRLARELAALINATDFGRRGEVADMLREITAAVTASYGATALAQSAAMAELAALEAAWAARAGAYAARPSEAAMRIAVSRILAMGTPIDQSWTQAGQNMAWRIGSEVRTAAANGEDAAAIRARVIGTGTQQRGGLMERARQGAQALVSTSVQATATAGRQAAWAAAGVDALRWVSVLDGKTTPGCLLRNGKLYTMGLDPIAHGIPIERPPPRHWNCRSILVPQVYAGRAQQPDDGGAGDFGAYLASLSAEQRADLLGEGRAELYARGVITQRDLVNQAGRLLTLRELRAITET